MDALCCHKTIGTDGSGGTISDRIYRRVATAAAVQKADSTTSSAVMRTPGKQTVPRAELYALCVTLETITDTIIDKGLREDYFAEHTVLIDASYVVKGINNSARHNSLRAGTNGDL